MNSQKGDDKFHVSKLFIESLVQYMSAHCNHVHRINPSKGFNMDDCSNVYEIYLFSK